MHLYKNIYNAYNTYMVFMAAFSVRDVELVSHGIRSHNHRMYIFQYFSD